MTNSRTRVHFLVLFGLALLGCHRHAGVGVAGGPQATDRQLRNAVDLAARDMQCPETTLSAAQIGESLYSIHGCGRSREYLLMCAGRRRACRWQAVVPVENVAASETGCGAFAIGEPSPIERTLTGCNMTVSYMIGCNVSACAWGHAAGGQVVQTAATPTTAPTATPMATTTTTTTTVQGTATIAPSGDPQGQLMDLASARWAQAQACLGGQHIDATLTLGMDGHIAAQLDAPLHGTSAEACVQGVVGDVVVQMQGQTAPVSVMLTL
jgi:hypothetical protein